MLARLAIPSVLLLLASCASPPRIAAPAPATPPVVLAPPKPLPSDWRDMAESKGTWTYAQGADGSSARFGEANATPLFELRCRRAERTIELLATGTAGEITVVTSYGPQAFPATPTADARLTATLPASHPFLDKIAFSRGRFEIVVKGRPPLILPAWAEPARVIEDCRG